MTVTAIQQAAKVLIDGGVVAYPTEGVFGLGCMPHNRDAVSRILHIKRRPIEKGLILVASTPEQLRGWISPEYIITFPEPDPGAPITWIVKAGDKCTPAITGSNDGVAVRLTTHDTAQALCNAVTSALVSTSANLSGEPAVANQEDLSDALLEQVDFVVPGACGPAAGPSEIRRLHDGSVLRPRTNSEEVS